MSTAAPWTSDPVVDSAEPWKADPVAGDADKPWTADPVAEQLPDTSFRGALRQGFDQPLEAIGTTMNVLGIPGGKALQGAVDAPANYESASERFVKPQEGDTTVFGFAPAQMPRAIVEQAGQLGGSILSRVAGTLAGRGIGAATGGPAGAIAGGVIGSFSGPFLFGAMQIAGPTAMERAKRNGRTEPNGEDISAALATAAASGSLDAVGAQFLPGGKGAVGSFVAKFGKALFGEQVTESAQSIVEQIGESAGTDMGLAVSVKQAIGEGILGAGAAGAATVASAPFAEKPATKPAPTPAAPMMAQAQQAATASAEAIESIAADLAGKTSAPPITPEMRGVRITPAPEPQLPTTDAIQEPTAGEVGVRNPPEVREGVGGQDQPEITPAQGEAALPKGEEVTIEKAKTEGVQPVPKADEGSRLQQAQVEPSSTPTPTEPSPVATPAAVSEPAPSTGKPVEQMTPEEAQSSGVDGKTAIDRAGGELGDLLLAAHDAVDAAKYRSGDRATTYAHAASIISKVNVGKPVSAAAVESYGIKLPEGWTQRGDLWHPPEAKPAAQAPAPGAKALLKREQKVLDTIRAGRESAGQDASDAGVMRELRELASIQRNYEREANNTAEHYAKPGPIQSDSQVANQRRAAAEYAKQAEKYEAMLSKLEQPTPAPSPAPEAEKEAAPLPKLRKGQKQGDLLGGSEDLTLVGEKAVEKAPAKPKEQPSVQETMSDAVAAYGDLASAGEHLQRQLEHPDTPPADKARLKAALRKMDDIARKQSESATEEEIKSQREGQYELLESVAELGGLPDESNQHHQSASGELRRIIEALPKGSRGKLSPKKTYFKPDAKSLDTLREALNERGFNFETPYDMLTAIEDSLSSGKSKYGDYLGGPGAMGPVEASEMQEGGKTTGLKKAVVKDERLQRGLDDLPPAQRQSEEERVQRAEDAVDADETLAPKLVARIVDEGVAAISPDDAAVLLVERTRLMNERTTWSEAMQDNPTEAKAKLDDIERQMERLDVAQRRAGSSWGRTGHMYQRLMREDYTLEAMKIRARAAKGGPLNEDERAKLEAQAASIKRLQEQLAELDKQATEANQKAERTAILEATIADLLKENQSRPAYDSRIIAAAESIVKSMETRAEAASKRLRSRLGMTSAGIDPTILLDVAEIMAAKIARFGLDFAKTSTALIAEFGEDVQPYLQKAWIKANKLLDRDLAAKPVKVRDKIKEGVSAPVKGEKTVADVGARAKAEATAGMELGNKTAYDAVRAVINSGVKGEAAIMKAAHDLLKPAYPNLTPGELDIAFSEYGKAKYPSTDAVKMELAKLRRLRQMQAAIDDVKKRGETAKSGLQRAKADADVRQREKELKDAIEEFGKAAPASPEQLANREQIRLTRAKNAIEDLDRELRTGEARIKVKPEMPSKELEQLQSELAAMRELKREIEEAQNPPPQEHEVELSKLQDRADVLRDRLARMELTTPRTLKFTADTAEIAAVKAEIKSITETMAELRKPIPLSPAQKALDAALVARERAQQTLDDISTGTVKPSAMPKEALTQLEEDVRLETAALRQLAVEMRRDAKPRTDPEFAKEQARIKALESAIARYAEKTAASDFSAGPKLHGPDTVRVAQLKEIRDSRKAAYEAARRAERPVVSPEERYNATRIKQVNKQIEALEKRLKDRDFGPRVKPPKKVKSAALEKLEVKLGELRSEVDKETYKMALKNAPLHAKIWRGVQMTRGAFVNLLSSLDFSGPRQALTAILANTTRLVTSPVSGARMLYNPAAKMFQSWSSETRARTMENRRKDRPNAKNGTYDLMGLEFSSLDTNTFTKFEENAHSILDEWAELPFRTGDTAKTIATAIPKAAAKAVRMSNRAFITFLNETRAELADELLRVNYADRAPTVDELKVIGNLVNVTTGRGRMKPITSRVASEALWAPKLLAARFQLLSGQPIWTRAANFKGSGRARLIVAKEYARMIASGYLLWSVSRLFDEKDEEDPRSSDFGKIVRGNIRIDPWGGLSQVVIAVSRVGTTSTKTLKGDVVDIGGDRKYGVRGAWYLLADFLRSKARPDIGAAISALDQKDFKGRMLSPSQRLEGFVPIPLPLDDIAGIMRERGFSEGMVLEALQQFGAGIQRYEDDSQEKPRR